MTRPPPLSRTAAARWIVEMPNDVPNSTIDRAWLARASRYSSAPVSRDTARKASLARAYSPR